MKEIWKVVRMLSREQKFTAPAYNPVQKLKNSYPVYQGDLITICQWMMVWTFSDFYSIIWSNQN